MCSLAARGLWIELLALMHEAHPYGHLVVRGNVPSTAQIASLARTDADTVAAALAELESHGVFSRDEHGRIVSRRMVRDHAKRERDRLNGGLGGNPRLKGARGGSTGVDDEGVNPSDSDVDRPHDKAEDKTQRPEARGQRKAERASANRGCRLPAGWKPSDETLAWARNKRPQLDIAETIERFADYYVAMPGQRGVRLDWDASFRTWVARERVNGHQPPTHRQFDDPTRGAL